MFRDQRPKRQPFDRIPADGYLHKLPLAFEETVRDIGFDIFYVPISYDTFGHMLVNCLKGDEFQDFAHSYDLGKEYFKITVGTPNGYVYLIVFRYDFNPQASAVLVSSEATVIEWCDLTERVFFDWKGVRKSV